MDIITDFTGWEPEKILAYCCQVLGVRERSPEEWETYYREEAAKEKARQAHLKEIYETQNNSAYPVYKKICPICKTIFYTYNRRKIYDDYYKCSRYKHRENAKFSRRFNRITECQECGKIFTPERAGARYCCSACKQKAYRERKQVKDQNEHTEEP